MEKFNDFLKPFTGSKEYKILPLAGDASSRRYFRVVTEENSWVLMDWAPFDKPERFPFLSVQKYFLNNNINVPKIFAFDPQAGFFLLEDLGDLTLERKFWEFQNQKNILPYYQQTLDELIKVHSLSYEKKEMASCSAYDNEFSVDRLMWEFNYTIDHLFIQHFRRNPSDSLLVESKKCFQNICENLYHLPQVICHRDFHSRNVMIKHGKILVIDFQDARLGPAVYDLVSLFYDSYVTLDDQTINQLSDYYINNFSYFHKQNLSKEQFSEAFSLQSIQRCLKACGSFSSFSNTRNDKRYLRYIKPTLARVVLQLEKFPKYSPIKELILATEDQWVQT